LGVAVHTFLRPLPFAALLLAASSAFAEEAAAPSDKAAPAPDKAAAAPAAPAPEKAAAAPAAPAPEKKAVRANTVAVMDTAAQGAPDTLAALMTQTLASYASGLGLEVISKDDVRKLISFEMQRQLLGCDTGTCGQASEIGQALGVEKLVTSTLGKIGERYQLSVVAMDVAAGKVAGRGTREVRSEDEIVENARDLAHFALKNEERESKGYLRIVTSENNASIMVDGREIGRTPMKPLRILGGKHRVFIDKRGYFPVEGTYEVVPGKETLIEAKLLRKSEVKVAGAGFLPWAWGTLGVAIAGGAASTYFYLSAKDIYDKQYMADAVTQSQLEKAKDDVNFRGNILHFYSAIGSGVLGGVSAVLFSAYFLAGTGAGGDEPPAVPVEPAPNGVLVRF